MDSEDIIKKNLERTKQEVRWWTYAAWTLPFVALAGLFFFNLLGWENAFNKTLVIGATIMFSISVFWWWWAIYKIFNFAEMMERTADKINTIKKEFNSIKDSLKK